tara:strand:- start:732 stop:1190 length:459 start_codon:yes stop_codon:yes gene_type:complete
MRNFDFSPLYGGTIGFDQIDEIMNHVISNRGSEKGYPPYNIEKTAEDKYRVSLAVAGFASEDLNVEIEEKELIITGQKNEDNESRTFLHQDIATRAFNRRFRIAEFVQVVEAIHSDGMLHIDLVRKIPAKLKPRRLKIKNSNSNHRISNMAS